MESEIYSEIYRIEKKVDRLDIILSDLKKDLNLEKGCAKKWGGCVPRAAVDDNFIPPLPSNCDNKPLKCGSDSDYYGSNSVKTLRLVSREEYFDYCGTLMKTLGKERELDSSDMSVEMHESKWGSFCEIERQGPYVICAVEINGFYYIGPPLDQLLKM